MLGAECVPSKARQRGVGNRKLKQKQKHRRINGSSRALEATCGQVERERGRAFSEMFDRGRHSLDIQKRIPSNPVYKNFPPLLR